MNYKDFPAYYFEHPELRVTTAQVSKAWKRASFNLKKAHNNVDASDEVKAQAQRLNFAHEVLGPDNSREVYHRFLDGTHTVNDENTYDDVAEDSWQESLSENKQTRFDKALQVLIDIDDHEYFDAWDFADRHPTFYKSVFGYSVKGMKIMNSLNSIGFVNFLLSGFLFHKLFNIILFGAGNGVSGLIIEIIFSIIMWLIALPLFCMYDRDVNDCIHKLPKFRQLFYFLEFIGLCIALGVADSNNGISSGLLFFIGLPNIWVCLMLALSAREFDKYSSFTPDQRRGLQIILERGDAEELMDNEFAIRAFRHIDIPDLFFHFERAQHGIVMRIVVGISSFFALFALVMGLLKDIIQMCNSSSSRRKGKCYTLIYLKKSTRTVQSLIDKMAECRNDNTFHRLNDKSDREIWKFLYGYATLFEFERLASIGKRVIWWKTFVNKCTCGHFYPTTRPAPENVPVPTEVPTEEEQEVDLERGPDDSPDANPPNSNPQPVRKVDLGESKTDPTLDTDNPTNVKHNNADVSKYSRVKTDGNEDEEDNIDEKSNEQVANEDVDVNLSENDDHGDDKKVDENKPEVEEHHVDDDID